MKCIYKFPSMLLGIIVATTSLISCGGSNDEPSSLFGSNNISLEGNTFTGEFTNTGDPRKIFISLFHENYGVMSMPITTGFGNSGVSSSKNVFWKVDGDSLIFNEVTQKGKPSEKSIESFYLKVEDDSTVSLINKDGEYKLRKVISSRKPLAGSIVLDKDSDSYFENEVFVAEDFDFDEQGSSDADKGLGLILESFFPSTTDLVFSFDKNSHGTMFGSIVKIPGTSISMVALPVEIFWGVKGDNLYVQTAYPNELGEAITYKIVSKNGDKLVLSQTSGGKSVNIKLRKQSDPF